MVKMSKIALYRHKQPGICSGASIVIVLCYFPLVKYTGNMSQKLNAARCG